MARNLESLHERYGSHSSASTAKPHGHGMPGRGGRRGGMQSVEKPTGTKNTVARLMSYISGCHLQMAFVIIMMLVSTACSLIGSYMLFPIINRLAGVATTVENSGIMAVRADKVIDTVCGSLHSAVAPWFGSDRIAEIMVYVFSAVMILILVYIIEASSTYLQSRVLLSVSQGAIERIRRDLFAKIQKLPLRYFDTHTTGDIMSRFTNDIDAIGTMFDTSLINVISGIITLLGTFVFMITTNWFLTLITVLFIPLFVKGGSLIAGMSRKYFIGQQTSLGAVNGYIEETVSGQKVIKVFNHEDECRREFSALNEDLMDKQFKAQFFGGIMGPVMGNIEKICYGITVGIGGILMCTTGFTPGALTVFAQYAKRFTFPIINISQQITSIFSAVAGAERVFNAMDTEPESNTGKDRSSIAGDVELKNVSFGYEADKRILHDISLHAPKGKKVAFVGSTGAGKTTITNLLNRFYDIDEGEILIDGKDLKAYDRDFLRENITVVLQETHLFTGTVMENIRYGRLDATDEEVVEAAKTASAHSFIMRLADGYDTVLEGDGTNLSQGQRQLINIARAAISKAPILVLDEATSSVDTRTERNIEKGMDRLMESRTTFVIAHRLSTVRNSDEIMVLEKGEIIERGTHDELLELGGRYYELYNGIKELS